mmetsp:Transcript_89587/g.214124  ORF Transcript_89587/g.214124 Transcript_89587/m.214124 type:complete len:311 (+) Transcript_89587:113-1045(+)
MLELAHLRNPAVPHGLALRGELAGSELHAAAGGQVHLEGPRVEGVLILQEHKLGIGDVIGRVIHQLSVFLLAPVHQAAVLCNPHLALEPILLLLAVAFGLDLPKLCLEDRRELVLGVFAHLHPAILHRQPELFQLIRHRAAQADGLHGPVQVGGLRQQGPPLLVLRLGLRAKAHGDVLLVVIAVDTVQLKRELTGGLGHVRHLGAGHLDAVQQDQALVLLDAEVAQRAVAGDPHVSLEPVRGIFCLAICVELPQGALVERRLAGGVLESVPVLAVHLLALVQIRFLLPELHDVGVRKTLGQGFPLGVIGD